ncbi:MAG: 50S ribosomal protein L10 [Holosporaceae bacterium]|jgi:large subunit ribosomal protein L10|nr:50S ribosomal protein L10 [Holosporaceae bacterium]
MKRSEKADAIAKIRKRFEENGAVFVVNQNRMTVANTEDLRKRLRDVNSVYLVSKNTLAKIAAKEAGFDYLLDHLNGQTALAFSNDVTGSAKVICEYASKSEDKIVVVCGGYEGRLLSDKDVKVLSQLPSMDELRAKIIAVIQTPAQRMATLLQAPAGQLARVLKAYSEK